MTVVAVFGLQWALVSLAIHRVIENHMATRLDHDLESLLAALSVGKDSQVGLPSGRVAMVYDQPFSGHYYRIAAEDSVLRSRSLWDQDLAIPVLEAGKRLRLYRTGPENQPLLVLARGFRKQGVSVTLAVGEDLAPIHRDIRRFQLGYLLLSVVLLAGLILLQRYSVGCALAPLVKVRVNLRQLSQGEVERIAEDVLDEIRPLAHEINRLLELLKRRLTQSRTAIGNLAHALKTPLTLLTQLADEDPVKDHPKLQEKLAAQTTAIRERLERELKRAQLAGSGPATVRFRPENDLPALVEVLKRMHGDKPLDLRLNLPESVVFAVDREDMLELIGNLANNACQWARRQVSLTLEDHNGLCIVVEDDGPGRSEEELRQIGQRGLRLDESREGHGLGLAIARDIVEGYGGQIEFTRSEALGGLRVRVLLPRQEVE